MLKSRIFATMETVVVQIRNQKAMQLLLDLEDLQLIKVIKQSVAAGEKLSDKYAGKLPLEIGEQLQNFVTQSREEWGNPVLDRQQHCH